MIHYLDRKCECW